MIAHDLDPTGLSRPLTVRGSTALATAHRALARITQPAMLAGQPGPLALLCTRALDPLLPPRIGDAALLRSLARLQSDAVDIPAAAPRTTVRPPQVIATPRRRRTVDRSPQVGVTASLPLEQASQVAVSQSRSAGWDGTPGAADDWTQRVAMRNAASQTTISVTGGGLTPRQLVEMARLDGGRRRLTTDPPAPGATPAAPRTATNAPDAPHEAPPIPERLTGGATTFGSAAASTRDTRTRGVPAGNGLGDLVQLWERHSTGGADLPAEHRPHREGGGGPGSAVVSSVDIDGETPIAGSRTQEQSSTFDHAASGGFAAADAPELGDEALLLELLERALRSEARRHGIRLDAGGLW